MGYQASIEFEGGKDEVWVGEHRPDLVDLSVLFRHLVALDVASLVSDRNVAAECWRKALPHHVHLIQMLGSNTVHLHDQQAPLVRDLVVKVIPPKPDRGWRKLTARVERSRSHRAHLWAHRLRALGIETPRPMGYIERSVQPALHVSFVASEFIFAPTLLEIRERPFPALGIGPTAIAERRALIDRIAAFLRTMHARGLVHADLHAGNILIPSDAVMLIDLESMRRLVLPGRRATTRNLVRLNRDFLDTRQVTRTDRMRFLRTYLRHHSDQVQRRRELWMSVFEATVAKLQERGEAFR